MSGFVGNLHRFNEEHTASVGKAFALLSALSNASHIIIVRSFPQGINPIRIVNNEMIVSLVLVSTINFLVGGAPLHPREDSKANLLFVRALLGVPGFACAVVGAYLVPAKVFVVVSNCNVIFATILGSLIHMQFPSFLTVILIFLFFAGVVVITDPGLLGLHTTAPSAQTKDCSRG